MYRYAPLRSPYAVKGEIGYKQSILRSVAVSVNMLETINERLRAAGIVGFMETNIN